VKSQIMARLTGQTVSVRFSDTLDPRFYEELTSERLVVKYSRGSTVRRWESIVGRRAEALDCVVYGWSVRKLTSFANEVDSTNSPNVARSSWLSRSS
jgi:phage terminase large subunit GpA-like protein